VRASGTAGSFGEFDMLSPLNPASIASMTRTVITAQTEPEYRTVKVGGTSEGSSVQRVPLIMLGVPLRSKVALALSATTFLDRSFSTTTQGEIVIDSSTLTTSDFTDVRASIADIRFAAGWNRSPTFSLGFGLHLFTGDDQATRLRTFSDSTRFGTATDSSKMVYFGTALSAGGEWRMRKGLAAQLSYRLGLGMKTRFADTTYAKAKVPNRLGVGLRYDGIPGSTFAIGIDHQDWTRMQELGSSLVTTRDATNWHVGGETEGPQIRGMPMLVRAGYARNALPFGVEGKWVNESRYSTGVGIPVARDQASIDFSAQWANRTLAGGGAKETAWLIGIGVQIRP
jgi:opacity protein-like surface antigen